LEDSVSGRLNCEISIVIFEFSSVGGIEGSSLGVWEGVLEGSIRVCGSDGISKLGIREGALEGLAVSLVGLSTRDSVG